MGAMGKTVAAAATAALALALGSGALAQQQQQPVRTEPVVVTATRTPVPAGGSIGSLGLVTREQIEATAATDIKASLELVPSLILNDAGGPGGVATISLRGSTSQQVLVLMDGKRLANAQSSFFNINDLPVPIERVERIEVLPTPASALYGADALGGVVNIITRPAGTVPALRVGYGRGADEEQRISGGIQYGFGKLGLSLDGQLHSGDGYRDNGDFEQTNFAAAATLLPAPWGLDLRWSHLEREAGVPGPEAFPSPNARQDDDRDSLRADFTYRPGGGWDIAAGVYTQSQTLEFKDPDPPDFDPAFPAAPIESRHENRSQGADFQWNFGTARGELYTIGGEWVADEIESTNDGDHDTDRWAVFAQDQWRAGAWSAVGAIRYDDHSVYGDQTSPSLSVAWENRGWKLWGAWAEGYRAPNFDDLYWNEQFLQGNPDLESETASNWEGGVQFGGAAGRARLSVFRRDVDNLIRWVDTDGDFVYRPENVAEARFTGWEAEVVYRPSATIAVPLGYQMLTAEDEATGERLSGSVHSLWRAAVQGGGKSLSWSLEYSRTDRGQYRYRDEDWNYGVFNAALSWKGNVGKQPVKVSLRGENLLDEEYQTVEGYPMPGSTWFAEVQISL